VGGRSRENRVFLFCFCFFCCYCIEVPRSLSHRVVKPSMALLLIEVDIVSRALSDPFLASIRSKMQQNTHSVFLYPLNEFQVISTNFTWRSPTMHNWNSSPKLPEPDSEDYREKQENSVSILVHFLKTKTKKSVTQNSLYIYKIRQRYLTFRIIMILQV